MKTLSITKLFIPLFMAVILPPATLLVWLFVAMVLDLITGVAKAIKKDIPRTSEGFRRTVAKFIQYGGAVAIGIILANIVDVGDEKTKLIYGYFSNSMLMFIIYIEIKSILENLTEISPDSDFTKLFLRPIHKILSIDFKQFFKADKK
jgi:phage-related holin